jgi:site-specific recombinase XerD
MSTFSALRVLQPAKKQDNFATADDFAKLDDLADSIAFQVRKRRLSYNQLCYVFKEVRKRTGLKRPKKGRCLPQLLTKADLEAFFGAIDTPEHEVMMRFLLYTAIRVNELVNIRMSHVDLSNCKVYIEQGKGSKDRYILFPHSMRLALSTYMQHHRENAYLFESNRYSKYSPRRIQQLMREYGRKAGLGDRVHPHLFRHQMLTTLTSNGLSDAQIQLISGHATKKSLEVYQHLGLQAVEEAYQTAVRAMED